MKFYGCDPATNSKAFTLNEIEKFPEVTPAMVEAGVAEYHRREDGLGIDREDVVAIYIAMEAAKPKKVSE